MIPKQTDGEEEEPYVAPAFPSFDQNAYETTPLGVHVVHVDFRQKPLDYVYEKRPVVKDGSAYTDKDFTLQKAMPKRHRGHEWKRCTVRDRPFNLIK